MAFGTPAVQVPQDDGAIQRAFEQLDAQMSTWLAAMERAHGALQAEPAREAGPADRAVASAPAELVAVQPAAPPAALEAVPEPEVNAAPEPVAPEAADPGAGSVPRIPAAETRADIQATPPPGAPVAAPAEAPRSPNDDEALLATLDEETAKAIRVMRRLSMNQKSVRQLLEEYQSGNGGQAAAAADKKSWWRRK